MLYDPHQVGYVCNMKLRQYKPKTGLLTLMPAFVPLTKSHRIQDHYTGCSNSVYVSSCFCSNMYQHRFIAHIITFIHALSTINTLWDNPGDVKGGMVNYLVDLTWDSGKHPQRNGKLEQTNISWETDGQDNDFTVLICKMILQSIYSKKELW